MESIAAHIPLALKYVSGATILLIAAYMVWHDKLDKSILASLLIGAAGAVGFVLGATSVTPAP